MTGELARTSLAMSAPATTMAPPPPRPPLSARVTRGVNGARPRSLLESFLTSASPAVAWVVVGQPFDVVRTRVAAATGGQSIHKGGVLEILGRTLFTEGPLAFWRGALPALVATLPNSLCLFVTFDHLRPKKPLPKQPSAEEQRSHYLWVFAAGFGAGIPTTLIQNPLDVWRTRSANAVGQSQAEVLREIIYGPEPHRVLLRGTLLTAFRNIPGIAVYFTGFEYMMHQLEHRESLSFVPTSSRSLVAGGFTGIVYGVLVHPADMIRINLMTLPKGGTITGVAQTIIQRYGLAGLYRGVAVQVLRGAPTNGAGLWAYHTAQGFFDGGGRRWLEQPSTMAPSSWFDFDTLASSR